MNYFISRGQFLVQLVIVDGTNMLVTDQLLLYHYSKLLSLTKEGLSLVHVSYPTESSFQDTDDRNMNIQVLFELISILLQKFHLLNFCVG